MAKWARVMGSRALNLVRWRGNIMAVKVLTTVSKLRHFRRKRKRMVTKAQGMDNKPLN